MLSNYRLSLFLHHLLLLQMRFFPVHLVYGISFFANCFAFFCVYMTALLPRSAEGTVVVVVVVLFPLYYSLSTLLFFFTSYLANY